MPGRACRLEEVRLRRRVARVEEVRRPERLDRLVRLVDARQLEAAEPAPGLSRRGLDLHRLLVGALRVGQPAALLLDVGELPQRLGRERVALMGDLGHGHGGVELPALEALDRHVARAHGPDGLKHRPGGDEGKREHEDGGDGGGPRERRPLAPVGGGDVDRARPRDVGGGGRHRLRDRHGAPEPAERDRPRRRRGLRGRERLCGEPLPQRRPGH